MAKAMESIGKYQVLKQLARGGMGAVYTARHPTLERTVIIKKLTLRGNADIRERFRREAQIMMDLRNDAIVDVYDHFREGSSYYIVLEYVDGMSLDQLIRAKRYLPDHIALAIFREVCRGLAYAHERSVVHRDIKPANVLLSKTGEVKLVDFGIATIHGDESSELTREGMTLGTPSYMAPEQFQSTRTVDRRADIYSMGVVLYEMVTGKRPYPSGFTPEVIARIQRGRYPRPRSFNPSIWPFTARLIRRMLNPRADRRPHSLEPVIGALNRRLRLRPHDRVDAMLAAYLAGEELAGAPGRRRWGLRAVATAAVLAVAGGAGLGFSRGYHHELFQAGSYGALDVTVRLALNEESVPPALSGRLFVDDGTEIPPVEDGVLTFRRVPEEETTGVAVFRSQRMQLPSDDYRMKVTAGNGLWWESFHLAPLAERSAGRFAIPGSRDTAHRLTVEFLEHPALPLTVDWRARDRERGTVIEEGLLVSVREDDTWRLLTPFVARRLRTGQVHRFRFRHPDYEEQVFSLLVQPDQSTLYLDVSLDRIDEP